MTYRDKLYSRYVSTHTSNFNSNESIESLKKNFYAWRKYFLRFLPSDKNCKILDAGCGNGNFILWLEKLGFTNSAGVDISQEQIERARTRGIKNVIQSDLQVFLNSKCNSYDIIFARDVLEHFFKEEVVVLLEACERSLKNKGALIIQTVNAENLLWGRLRHGDFTHEVAFTYSSITQILKIAGFKEIEVYSQPPIVHGAKSFVRALFWKIYELFMKLYLMIETGSPTGIFTQNLIVVARK